MCMRLSLGLAWLTLWGMGDKLLICTAALLVLLQMSLQGWLHCRRGPASLAASNSFSSRGR